MSTAVRTSPLDHDLSPSLSDLARFATTAELEASALYSRLRPEIERIMTSVHTEFLAQPRSITHGTIHAAAWNIERGTQLDRIVNALKTDRDLRNADVLLLTELDYGMARTGNRFIAREIAEALDLNYAFAPCYLALNKGSGVEAHVEGENMQSLHGNALFSRHPMTRVHSLALPNGKDKMNGIEKRIGSQRAVIADIQYPLGEFRAVTLHLDAHSSRAHRHAQMRLLLDHLDSLSPRLPVLIGGDWNTTTHNAQRALYSILGYFHRVALGVQNVVRNHYPHPYRKFEKRLFRELEQRGYDYRSFNVLGACTLHYDVADFAVYRNMSDWIPQWCFWFIRKALAGIGGRCSLKLDWFAGKGLEASEPVVVSARNGGEPVSDHDAIVVKVGFPA
jgi:endonuclease/exonuclease/phosphatase family metal-dependent hydrolase